MPEDPLFPEVEEIISVLRSGEQQDLIVLIVPSHDKKDKRLNNQDVWAHEAMELFAELYGGATAFKTFAGIYKDRNSGKILHDQPILIECYATRSAVEDTSKLNQLLKFAKRMGKETRQSAVGLVINNVFHEITEF